MRFSREQLDPRDDPTSIGNLAVSEGYATKDQITSALLEQENLMPLGQILIHNKVIGQDQLDELLHVQQLQRANGDNDVTKLELQWQQKKAREAADTLRKTTEVMRLFISNNGAGS